ncbi:tripartite tricarboxylate transporter substrate binding protein [Pigmentiphaga sp. H8]|uniref:Bug family tripartite tricarboxylate transporter substrate binding protein n=1 Tax=Pigmentiphaga sp. H8 TaxID=2488560 RepID=UPI001EDFA3F1|nr:tripartite tricarboxylate transporter substrate binding protein [Pigmentiphaga sp. H8]
MTFLASPWRMSLGAACMAIAGPLLAGQALAASFPERPLKLVVPFPPGGGTDLVGRIVAEKMGEYFGKPVIVENRPGGGTVIGTDYVAKSPPDGYAIVMGTFAYAVNPSLQQKLPYSNETSLMSAGMVAKAPNVLVVNPQRPYKTVAELIAYAKANPGKINYGSNGNGTSAHLAGALFATLSGTELTHVPYKGAAPALNDLIGGQIDVIFSTIPGALSYIKAGKLRALAVTSADRSAVLPDLPTVAEAGVAGYDAQAWYGFLVPAGTPAPVVDSLNRAINQAAETPVFQRLVKEEGLIKVTGDPASMDRYVRAEESRWRKIIQDAGLQPN